ncbi:MAG TPA: hypothetical protein VLB84_16630, partial [Bacteroidia bacterium]|nr:hypothetical protein [Bacteroidia bacterium]
PIPDTFVVDATGERTPVDDLTLPSVTDACEVTVTHDIPPSGFLAGETTVTFHARDGIHETVATTRVIVRPRANLGLAIEPGEPLVAGLHRTVSLRA